MRLRQTFGFIQIQKHISIEMHLNNAHCGNRPLVPEGQVGQSFLNRAYGLHVLSHSLSVCCWCIK